MTDFRLTLQAIQAFSEQRERLMSGRVQSNIFAEDEKHEFIHEG